MRTLAMQLALECRRQRQAMIVPAVPRICPSTDVWYAREKVAPCILVTNPFGWELRLMTTDLLRSRVCRSSDEVLDTSEQWKAAMAGKGLGVRHRPETILLWATVGSRECDTVQVRRCFHA